MHYDSVHGCIFACCSHIVPSHTIDFLLSPCDEVTNIMRETFACRSFTCCRNWGVLSLQLEMS